MANQLITLIHNILSELKPDKLYLKQLSIKEEAFYLNQKLLFKIPSGKTYLLAMGKASAYEARAIEILCMENNFELGDGLVITKYGHAVQGIKSKIFESSHPIVDQNSFIAGQMALDFIAKIKENDHLIFCLSGGASALVENLNGDIELKTFQKINEKLIGSAISIEKINLLRKSVSKIKNGSLFENLKAPSTSLITCDIPSADLKSVSSSPSIYHPIDKNELENIMSTYLNESEIKKLKPLIKKDHRPYKKGHYFKIADVNFLKKLVKQHLSTFCGIKDFSSTIYDCPLDDALEDIVNKLKTSKTALSFGELNIEVKNKGLGGRNTHFVLVLANELFYNNVLNLSEEQLKQLLILSVGTDGTDGPTDAAGAYFSYDQYTKIRHERIMLEVNKYDSYNFFTELGTLIKTGPTGTNLMDLRIISYEKFITHS